MLGGSLDSLSLFRLLLLQTQEAMQSQGLRVQSLPAAPVSIPGWEARQSWNSTAVEASALGTYLVSHAPFQPAMATCS